MTDDQKRIKLKKFLEGDWEYYCKVTSKELFENGEQMRGGVMTISVNIGWIGISAKINGIRLWAQAQGDAYLMDKEVVWKTDAGIRFTNDNELSFSYAIAGSQGLGGITEDSYVITPDMLKINPGTFKHQRNDGKMVMGRVQLRKMKNEKDFKWAPDGTVYRPDD